MIGTLWRSEYGVLVCVKYKHGFLDLVYMDGSGYTARIHRNNMSIFYTQLAQPTEET
jgi:hypothetical protein